MQPFSDVRWYIGIKVKSFLKIVFLTIISVATSTATEYQTMRCADIMAETEIALENDAVFEQEGYVHALRTIDHMLREQKAEVACMPSSINGDSKIIFVSPPYADVQRALLHQRIAISLLAADHPIRTRYISHSYYVYTLERILI